jgi:hypothetical protein
MKRPFIEITLLGLVIVFACLVVQRSAKYTRTHKDAAAQSQAVARQVESAKDSAPAQAVATAVATHELSPLAAQIAGAVRAIAAGGDARAILADLRETLLAAGNTKAGAAILEYLNSGQDCATGLPFCVGPNGDLSSAPTMRTFLLDLLATVDPQAAVDYAQVVFDARTSADEFAVCLRNVGKIDTSAEGRAYVGKRALELLSDATLAKHPTAGFVEAFDALVYAGDTGAFTLLSSYLNKDKGVVLNMPAFMAIDRMVIDDPVDSYKALLDDSTLLADRPQTRAGLFARADLADADQLAEVETYVLRLNADGTEAEYFFDLLPNLNFMLTDGLLTGRVQVSGDTVQERLAAAASAVDTWLADPRLSAYKSQLTKAREHIAAVRGK